MTGSSDDMIFSSSGFHYDSTVLNVTAYETVGANFSLNVGRRLGRKNITGNRPFMTNTVSINTCISSDLHDCVNIIQFPLSMYLMINARC